MTVTQLREERELGRRRQLVDVRTPLEFASGHVPGAVNIPMDQIEGRLDDLDPSVPVVLICQSGQRATMTAEFLRGRLESLEVLEGGTSGWMRSGLPVVASASSRWALDRQVRLVAGLLVVLGAALAIAVNPAWIGLSGAVGAGLVFAAATNSCSMTSCLARMPWNRAKRPASAPGPPRRSAA